MQNYILIRIQGVQECGILYLDTIIPLEIIFLLSIHLYPDSWIWIREMKSVWIPGFDPRSSEGSHQNYPV